MSMPSITKDEAIRAIRYVLSKFSDSNDLEDIFEKTFLQIVNFKKIISSQKFNMAYQPIVDITADNSIHHYEMLARFDENISPYSKIKFAEDLGIIPKFDLATLGRAFIEAKKYPSEIFAVNISGKSIELPSFVKIVNHILQKNQDLNTRVFLEITESMGLTDLTEINRSVQSMRDLGFIVCLDDFGAGSASFQYLRDLTVDYVKIDGSYIRRMIDSEKDRILLQGLIDICDKLNIKVIAEFVETLEQEAMLRTMGVKYCQGWLYGKPRSF